MNTPIYEQETVVRFYRDEDKATVYTSDVLMMNKLDKLTSASDEWSKINESRFKDGSIADKTYECPKKFISFRSKKPEVKPLTEEQKERRREQLRNMRNSAAGPDAGVEK